MKKSQLKQLYPWSAEYVIAHAIWKSKKGNGRNPSTPYRGVRNPLKALEFAKKMAEDKEFRDLVIVSVDDSSIKTSDGWSFFINEKWGVTPRLGDIARFYGRGSIVRGLDINGVECFYQTKKEQYQKYLEERIIQEIKKRVEFEENKAAMDERYNNLPELFQRRIDKFRTNNPDFRWKFESYELFCCEQAVAIFTTFKNRLEKEAADIGITLEQYKKRHTQRIKFLFQEFSKMSFERQKEIVSDLDDSHSSNSFGFSLKLAFLYGGDNPEDVVKIHGALASLVGSEEYGCIPKAD